MKFFRIYYRLTAVIFKLLPPVPSSNTAPITIKFLYFSLYLSLRLLLRYVADVIVYFP